MSYFPHELGMFQGIIQNMVMNDQIDKIYLNASSNLTTNPISNVLDLNNFSTYWLSDEDENFGQWLKIKLTDRWISLTKFSFHGALLPPLSFKFEAKENDNEWVVLYSQNNSDILSNGPKTFPISKKVVARKFRWTNTGIAYGGYHEKQFRIAAIELFGTVTKCTKNCESPISYQKLPLICKTIESDIIHLKQLITLYSIVLIF